MHRGLVVSSLAAVLLSLTGCGPAASPPPRPSGPAAARPVSDSPKALPAPQAAGDGSDGRPFSISLNHRFPTPPDLLEGGRVPMGGLEGPVNNDAETDLDFFTALAFDRGENNGRLFFRHLNTAYPDRQSGFRSAYFVIWQPLDADHALAQRLPAPEGYEVIEAEAKPGKLLVTSQPSQGGKGGTRKDVYLWQGDEKGAGRFVPADPAFARLVAARLPAARGPEALQREAAFAHLGRREYAEGIEAFKEAIATKPDADAYLGLGRCYEGRYFMGETEAAAPAIAAYSQALALAPKHTRALKARGLMYVNNDQFEKGLADFTRLMAQQPREDDFPVLRAGAHAAQGAFLKKQGQAEQAKAAYAAAAADIRAAIQLNPGEPDHWVPLGDYLYFAGRYGEAAAVAKKVLVKDEAQTQCWMVLAFVSARNGNLAGARKAYEGAKANGVLTDQRREGIREMQSALQEHPGSPAIKGLIDLLVGGEGLAPADW